MEIFIAFVLQFVAVLALLFLFDGNKVGLPPKLVQSAVLSLILLGLGIVGGIFGVVGAALAWIAALVVVKALLRYEIGEALLFLFCLGIIVKITALALNAS
ncbi:MAG: hypothetical protein HYT94_04510 [Parcubacteria group bacterium]|nr:hypothetical protein [Parcubacteria group bacterium]